MLVVIGFALFLYYQKDQTDVHVPKQTSDALAILDERYAKGEIDEEEYTRRKKILRGD